MSQHNPMFQFLCFYAKQSTFCKNLIYTKRNQIKPEEVYSIEILKLTKKLFNHLNFDS